MPGRVYQEATEEQSPHCHSSQNADGDEEGMNNFTLPADTHFLDAGEVLVVERPLMDLVQAKPPAFFNLKLGM